MSHPSIPDDAMAVRLLSLLPRLLHALRRDRLRLADPQQDPLADMLSERRGQFRLLHTLLDSGPMTTQELAQRLEVAPPTISTMVHALAELDLVRRERDEADQRQVWISLSERGQRAVGLERGRMTDVLLHRFRQLDRDDQARIAQAVPALERLLQSEPRPCGTRKDD
jgi:DNA-binding MarR family transcriptional regulator